MSKSASISESCGIVCTEVFDEACNPSQEEIDRYALKIGLDPSEKHLYHLAKEGLMEPLPKHWKPVCDENTGAFYYYNKNTRQTQWDHPVDEKYRQKVNAERARLKMNSKISSNHEYYKNDPILTNTFLKSNKFPNTEPIQSFDAKPKRLGRFSDKHFLQNASKAEVVEKLSSDLVEKSVHFNLDKNYKISLSESDGESKVASTDRSDSYGEKYDFDFVKDIKISMMDKSNLEKDVENGASSILTFRPNAEKFNKNPFQTDIGKNTLLQPIKKTGYVQSHEQERNGAKFKENLGKSDSFPYNESSQDKFPSQGTVKSLQSRFSVLTNPFKKLPPLGNQIGEQKNVETDNSKDEKSNASKFEDKIKKLSEKLNTGFAEATRPGIRQKSISVDGESIQNDLIKKTFIKDNEKIVQDDSMHSLLKKFELSSSKNRDEKNEIDLLGEHAIDEQKSAISLSYCNTDIGSDNKSNSSFSNRDVKKTAQMRRNLFFSKMTEAVKAKPLSIDTDSETDSLKKNKKSHRIIIADEVKISKPKHSEYSEKSIREPLKAFPLESDDSTAFDISINLSNSEDHSKMSNAKNKHDLIDFSKDINDILDNNVDDIISEGSYVKLLIPDNLDAKVIESNSKTVQSIPKPNEKNLETEKLEKSNEISKTSSDTSVESQIQSNMHNISKQDGNNISMKSLLDYDIIEFPLEKKEIKIEDVAVRQLAKSSQTDLEQKKIGLEKFTQTIDIPNVLDDQERKDKKRLEEKYRMLKIKYNKLKRKANATVIANDHLQNAVNKTSNLPNENQTNQQIPNNGDLSESDDNYRYINNNNHNESSNKPTKYECLESLKKNLRKIDALIDLVPPNHGDTLHYKYPFKDVLTDDEDISAAGSDISYIRHRIHIEQKNVAVAKNALRREEERIKNKIKKIAGLEQLAQEQESLTEAEVELHRAKSILQEKTIRLRHMEASLRHILGPASGAGGASCDTLSDISSQSSGPASESGPGTGSAGKGYSRPVRMPSAFNPAEDHQATEQYRYRSGRDMVHHGQQPQQPMPVYPAAPMILCPGLYVPTTPLGIPSIQQPNMMQTMMPDGMPYRRPGTSFIPHVNSSHDLITENDINYQQNNANWEEGLQWLKDWMNRKDYGNMHDEPNIRIEQFYPKKTLGGHLRKQSV